MGREGWCEKWGEENFSYFFQPPLRHFFRRPWLPLPWLWGEKVMRILATFFVATAATPRASEPGRPRWLATALRLGRASSRFGIEACEAQAPCILRRALRGRKVDELSVRGAARGMQGAGTER